MIPRCRFILDPSSSIVVCVMDDSKISILVVDDRDGQAPFVEAVFEESGPGRSSAPTCREPLLHVLYAGVLPVFCLIVTCPT